ncbi:MAG: O-antigen ligase family protein [Patescibacteria group bacterium]
MDKLLTKKIRTAILFIVLAELISIFAYFLPSLGKISFFAIALAVLILTLTKLEYGIWILLTELIIGSKGYLFYFENSGIIISIRIAIWLIVMAVWLGKLLAKTAKEKKLPKFEISKKNNYFYYFIILFLFIAWGAVNGLLRHNNFSDLFFDLNGWFYFALIFPIGEVVKEKKDIYNLGEIFLASTVWLSFKTFFVLFAFSHDLFGSTLELYKWIRNTGVGEITQIQGGFYRVFFQSQIFVLIGFFIFLFFMAESIKNKNKKNLYLQFSFVSIFLAVILLSFSRSFWVGLAAGLFTCFLIILKTSGLKITLKTFLFLPLALMISAILIFIAVKFPYPRPLGGFDTAALFSDRVSQTDEAAISSRWQLLPPLREAIREDFISGKGFGASITYESKDPRVLESSADGQYTTYAFEWGWLDIWLKLGFFGLISYIVLMGKIIYDGLKIKESLSFGLAVGLLVLAAVSFFSPYTNHPLGIGYLIIAGIIISLSRKDYSLD